MGGSSLGEKIGEYVLQTSLRAVWKWVWMRQLETSGNWGWKTTGILVCQRLTGGFSHRAFVKICLTPQMKKYRSLWGMSTRNHNILYFVHIPRINLLNSPLCLWKARNPLQPRAFPPREFAPTLMQSGTLLSNP
jgi:hypothetical protein